MGIILKPFKWIGGLFLRAVLNPLSQALLILGVVFSVVVGVGSVLAGTFIMTGAYKLFATPCIALGCFFSGFLFQMFMSNYIFRSNAMRKSDYEKAKSESEKCIAGLKDQVAELTATAERLKSQRIDITSFKQIMQLALAEFDMKFDDVRIDWLKDEIELDKMMHDDKCPQYIGILHKEFKAKFGLDMKSVKVRRAVDKKKIFVYGLKPIFVGSTGDEKGWVLRQIQTFRLQKQCEVRDHHPDTAEELVKNGVLYKKDNSKKVDVCLDLNRINEISEQQEKDLQNRINNGFEAVKFAEEYVVNMGRSFVKCLLKTRFPACEIEFAGEPSADAIPFLNFVEQQDIEAEQITYENQNANDRRI